MIQIVCSLFIRERCSLDIDKKKIAQINKAQRGAILQLGKLVNKARLASNGLRRIFTGEAAAEKQLNKLAKQRILQQKSSWRPTQKMRDANLEGKKQAIRDAKAMRSAASKAELAWMKNNTDKATKVYKSGAMEFGGDANRLALQKVRQDTMKPFLADEAKRIRRNRAVATVLPIGLGIPAYNILTGKIYDNVFPYGYQNKKASDKDKGESWVARIKKFGPAAFGIKSDARKHFDQIAAADLTDPKQREEAERIYQGDSILQYPMGNASLEYVQNRFRNRTDFNDLYLGRPQTYNTLVPNSEYQSVNSRENPKIVTYTFADPTIRNMLRSQGRDFNLEQNDIDPDKGYGARAVSDHNGIFGDFGIVRNQQNGAGKYKEDWDFPLSGLTHKLGLTNQVIIADTIPGNQPRQGYRFGEHHNRSQI